MDAILAGKPAAAADMLLQRVKSCESVLNGTHWSVAQRLELLGQESTTATPLPELTSAQKEAYLESKARSSASQVDGRPSGGKGKAKNENREWQQKGGGKDRRAGKGNAAKGDNAKKGKEEGGGRA